MNHFIVDQLLVPFVVNLFFVFGILCFAVGVALIIDPVRLRGFSETMNYWVSIRRGTKWLVIPRTTDLTTHRFRYLIGLIFIICSIYSTFIIMTQIDVAGVMGALRIESMHAFVSWIIECARWFLIAGSVLVIIVSSMLIFFPKELNRIEKHTNHWYSFRINSKGSDTMYMHFDKWVEHYPRAMGWIVAAGALVVVFNNGY